MVVNFLGFAPHAGLYTELYTELLRSTLTVNLKKYFKTAFNEENDRSSRNGKGVDGIRPLFRQFV